MGLLSAITNLASKPPAAPVAPRKAAPATSYQASGLIPPPNLDSEGGSSQAPFIIDTVPELVSPFTRLQTYKKMMNDAGVDVSVRAAKTPVLGAEFFMEPYSSEPQDVLISEFVSDNLMAGMSSPFVNSLEDILHMYEDAYSVLEKVYELRTWSPNSKGANSKQYTMLKKLGVRPAATIKQIDYDDNGGPTVITQSAVRADKQVDDVPLDISKLMIFTMGRNGGDITGKSILRTAYAHWYYKQHFYKIDAIQKERHSLGVPKGMLKPGYTEKDKRALRTLLKNLRSNEESFMMLPPNVDVEFAEVHGNLVDVLKSADHHNQMLLLNVMAAFLTVGLEGSTSGGKSSSGSQVDIFMKSLRFVANYIADVINMYLIPELVVYNFPTTNFPKLQVRNIGETRDLQMLGSALSGLLAQGAFEMDDPTETWMRRVFDMPTKDPTTTRPNINAGGDPTSDAGTNNNGNKGTTKAGNKGNSGIAPNAGR